VNDDPSCCDKSENWANGECRKCGNHCMPKHLWPVLAIKKEEQMNNDDLTLDQKRVLKVLERMAEQVRSDNDMTETYSDELDMMLDELLGQDFFGTEGQNDPRGDHRDESWHMGRVQGVDE